MRDVAITLLDLLYGPIFRPPPIQNLKVFLVIEQGFAIPKQFCTSIASKKTSVLLLLVLEVKVAIEVQNHCNERSRSLLGALRFFVGIT